MRVSVSPAFVLFWAALYFFDDGVFYALAVSVTVHELCHLIAIRVSGCGVSQMRFRLDGVTIVTRGVMTYKREALCAAAGPIGSAVLAVVCARVGLYTVCGVSAVLLAFNLLPILPLDGGRVVYSLTADTFGVSVADTVSFIASCVVFTVSAYLWAVSRIWIFVYVAVISCCQMREYGVKSRIQKFL